MNKIKATISAGAILGLGALGLVGGVAYAAAPHQAQTPTATGPKVVRYVGKVQSVSGTGLVLQARKNETINVNVSANTWVLVATNGACSQGQLSDIHAGEAVAVAGMSATAANTVDARVVAQGACARRAAAVNVRGKVAAATVAIARHTGEGTVKSITGSTLTVTTAKGQDLTVNATAETVVFDNGFNTVSAIKTGDKIQVFGRPDRSQAPNSGSAAGRTLTAWAIHDLSANTKIMVGRVDSVSGGTVTLRTPRDRNGVSVTLDSSTGYKSVTVASDKSVTLGSASQSDVKAGANVLVEVSTSADGKTNTAKSVVVLPAAKGRTTKP